MIQLRSRLFNARHWFVRVAVLSVVLNPARLHAKPPIDAPLRPDRSQSENAPNGDRSTPAEPTVHKARLVDRDAYAKTAERLASEHNLEAAVAAANAALAIERNVFGELSHEVAARLEQIAQWRLTLGQFDAARLRRDEALQIVMKLYGADHWKTRDSRLRTADVALLSKLTPNERVSLKEASQQMTLALQSHRNGNTHEAIAQMQNVCDVRGRLLGAQHRFFAASLNNLALFHQSLGDFASAEPLLVQARDISKHVFGASHPSYATSLSNLAELYRLKGDFATAETIFVRARDLRKRILGPDHPDYAANIYILGVVYFTLGDYARRRRIL